MNFYVGSLSDQWVDSVAAIDVDCNPAPWSRNVFEREFVNPCARMRGLFADDIVVGFLIAHIVFDEAHIVSFGVISTHQGKGGGQLLLADFMRTCRLERVSRITLQVRRGNNIARRLYVRNGFINIGTRKNYYTDNGEDALTMGLDLRS